MSADNHMDGRNRLRKTLDGTWIEDEQPSLRRTGNTYLKYCVREEENCKGEEVLCVVQMEIIFQMIQL